MNLYEMSEAWCQTKSVGLYEAMTAAGLMSVWSKVNCLLACHLILIGYNNGEVFLIDMDYAYI